MAYTLSFSLSLGEGQAGLTLAAMLVDIAGSDVGSEITSGFVEIGNGTYLWTYASIPDDHRGAVKFYQSGVPGTILAFAAINPEEGENSTTILNRIGAFAASGVNTILGFFQALMRSDATLPSDVGGDWTPTTDSTEAIRDRGDAHWTKAVVATVVSSSVSDDKWTLFTHDYVSQGVESLGDITGYTVVWVTVKKSPRDSDNDAIILVSSDVGLERLNGAATTAAYGSVTVDVEGDGDITIVLEANATSELSPGSRVWAIKWKDASGKPRTLLDSVALIVAGPVKAIS